MGISNINFSLKDNEAIENLIMLQDNEEKPLCYPEKYKNIQEKISCECRAFEKTISEEQREHFIKILNLHNDLEVEATREGYVLGFKTAFKIGMDCIK